MPAPPTRGIAAAAKNATNQSPDEMAKTRQNAPGSNCAASPATRFPRAHPSEPYDANLPMSRSAVFEYTRRAAGYIPTVNPRAARLAARDHGSNARGWAIAATAEARIPRRRTRPAPLVSAARPKRNDANRMNPLYAATMNPICSGEAEIGGARAYRGMNRPDAEAAAFTRKVHVSGTHARGIAPPRHGTDSPAEPLELALRLRLLAELAVVVSAQVASARVARQGEVREDFLDLRRREGPGRLAAAPRYRAHLVGGHPSRDASRAICRCAGTGGQRSGSRARCLVDGCPIKYLGPGP